jgi:VRR-NUC domain
MESPLLKKIMLALGTLPGVRSFRNNVALAAAGRIQWIKRTETIKLNAGDAVVRNARPLHAGLVKGSGDLIGWKRVTVTPEMVGKDLAVFMSVEVKDGDNGKTSTEQNTWRNVVIDFGGIAIVARSEADAVEQISKSI